MYYMVNCNMYYMVNCDMYYLVNCNTMLPLSAFGALGALGA